MGAPGLDAPARPSAPAGRPTTVLCAEVGPAPAPRHLEILGEAAALSGGRVLHQHASGVLALFPTPDAAAAAAARMHAYAETLPPGQSRAQVRIGLHHGPVAQRDHDIFGDTVNLALALAAEAQAGQILASHDTACGLSPPLQALVRPLGSRAREKGGVVVGELAWRNALGRIVSGCGKADARAVLRVECRGRTLVRRREGDTVLLGRDPECDLRVEEATASKRHCALLRRGAAFFLRDHSTNGTFLAIAGQGEVRVQAAEHPLGKSGVIALGQPCAATAYPVRYACD